MTLTDTEKLALLERYFAERPSPLFGERLRLMELAFAENPIWLKRKLAEIAPTPAERLDAVANIRSKQSPKRQGATAPIPRAFSAALSTVSASPTSIGNGASTISVIVKDVNGNGLPGVQVVLAATGTGNTLVQPRYATFANGLATGTLSSTDGGTKTVSATANGSAITQTAVVVVEDGLPVTSGVAGWWNTGAIVGLNDNDPVGTWPDSSGNGRDVTQGTAANRPLYKTNILNGKPIVRFDGTNDLLSLVYTRNQPETLFVVFAWRTGPASGRGVVDGTAGALMLLDTDVATPNQRARAFAGASLANTTLLGTTWHVVSVVFNGATSEVHVNGDAGASGNTSTSNGGGIIFGARGPVATPSNFGPSDMAEVISYSRALSVGERQQVETYLMSKYAIV